MLPIWSVLQGGAARAGTNTTFHMDGVLHRRQRRLGLGTRHRLYSNLGETTGVPELAGVSFPSVTGDTRGVLGGGQVGCNYQFAPNWVIGIEGDGEAADIKGDVTESVSFTDPLTGAPQNSHRNGPCPDRLDRQRHRSPRLDMGSRDALCQGWRGMGG